MCCRVYVECGRQRSTARDFHHGDMGSTKQRNEPSLTPELWAKVFANVERRPAHTNVYGGTRNQAEVHQLKLVCKQFKGVFESHSELVQRLYLKPQFSVGLVPSLLAWLHQNKDSIRVCWASCTGSVADVVLAGLMSAPNMRMLYVLNVSACSVSLVGTYKRLEKCTFRHKKAAHVGLAPLGSLPKLRELVLEGNFKELHHLTGLTLLECHSCRVSGAQHFLPALQYLELTDSDLEGVDAQTLPACTALTQLMLSNASLKGNNAYVYLDRNLSLVPINIGQLTQLQTLHLSTGAEGTLAELKWVSELTSLQELSMYFDHSSGDVLQHVSLLTNLTCLGIGGVDAMNETCLLYVDVEWHKLQALRKLSMETKTLHLGENIFGLLQLPKLQKVLFEDCIVHAYGPSDIGRFAALIYKFARLRPEVELVFDSGALVA